MKGKVQRSPRPLRLKNEMCQSTKVKSVKISVPKIPGWPDTDFSILR